MFYKYKNNGFSLVEVLIVLGIILIIASALILRLDPTQKMSEARNNNRQAHINNIRRAFQEYYAKNNRNYPACLDTSTAYIEDCTSLVPDYLGSIPEDPSGNSNCYFIETSSVEGVIVTAECAENEEIIKAGQ